LLDVFNLFVFEDWNIRLLWIWFFLMEFFGELGMELGLGLSSAVLKYQRLIKIVIYVNWLEGMQILLAFEVMYQRVSRGSTGSW
jgi:hypothetical protein